MKNTALLLIFLIFYSCNAPRNNPLDPYAEKGNLAVIEGQVQNFSPPFVGIAGVSVFWQAENILVKTDNQGFFKIENLNPQDALLIFSKEGYQSDSVKIKWNDSKNISEKINLNKNPILDSTMFFSVTSMNQDSTFTSRIFIDIKIDDPDNDIDSVYIKNKELKITKKLQFNVSNKAYESDLSLEELKISDLEQIIGLNFNVIIDNIFNKTFNVGSIYLKRVLKNGANIISPINSDTVSVSPTLSWTKFNSGFKFSYRVEIFTDPLRSMAPVISANVSSEKNSLKITDALEKGSYFWVVSTVDEYKNRFQSQTQIFHVE